MPQQPRSRRQRSESIGTNRTRPSRSQNRRHTQGAFAAAPKGETMKSTFRGIRFVSATSLLVSMLACSSSTSPPLKKDAGTPDGGPNPSATGGKPATGGATRTGGATGSGGATSAGGRSGSGGATAIDGSSGTGGGSAAI